MKRLTAISLVWILGLLISVPAVSAQGICSTPGDVLIVLDRSGSCCRGASGARPYRR